MPPEPQVQSPPPIVSQTPVGDTKVHILSLPANRFHWALYLVFGVLFCSYLFLFLYFLLFYFNRVLQRGKCNKYNKEQIVPTAANGNPIYFPHVRSFSLNATWLPRNPARPHAGGWGSLESFRQCLSSPSARSGQPRSVHTATSPWPPTPPSPYRPDRSHLHLNREEEEVEVKKEHQRETKGGQKERVGNVIIYISYSMHAFIRSATASGSVQTTSGSCVRGCAMVWEKLGGVSSFSSWTPAGWASSLAAKSRPGRLSPSTASLQINLHPLLLWSPGSTILFEAQSNTIETLSCLAGLWMFEHMCFFFGLCEHFFFTLTQNMSRQSALTPSYWSSFLIFTVYTFCVNSNNKTITSICDLQLQRDVGWHFSSSPFCSIS